MNLIRNNTDYALRIMAYLASCFDTCTVSVREVAEQEDISYHFACKILQKLSKAGLVESQMGPKGGYKLRKAPRDITMAAVIEAVQGSLTVNYCTPCQQLKAKLCPRQDKCPVHHNLTQLQKLIDDYCSSVRLSDIAG